MKMRGMLEKSMMRFVLATVLLLLPGGLLHAGEPVYFEASPGALAEAKARLAAHDPSLQPALNVLVHTADRALNATPPSVMDKGKVPPSGDKHDYMTIAPYFWPDTNKPDGLPYIRRDGVVNPESRDDALDHGRIVEMANTVETLSLAYYFTGKEVYARQAANFLRVWFLDPATRMNPHLNYAQAVLGENTGRGTGILEGRNISQAADAAQLLIGSQAWTAQDQKEFKTWLETYLNWLLNSKNGQDEAKAANNHGSWYDVQAMELALVLNKMDVAKKIAEAAPAKRIARQIQPDGKQPLELARTAAFGYSHFNLEALYTLAMLSEYVGVDLWHCRLANGNYALATALDFLTPYLGDNAQKWPYQQIKNFDATDFGPQLRQAAIVYHNPDYEKLLATLPGATRARFQLLSLTQATNSAATSASNLARHQF